jgi:signal peptidase II
VREVYCQRDILQPTFENRVFTVKLDQYSPNNWSFMKKYLKSYTFLMPITIGIVALDQWTKYLVRINLPFNQVWMPWDWLLPYARIVHWRNTGAAFGIGQGMNLFFIILAFLVMGMILYYFPEIPENEFFLRLALSLQLGGAAGNLIDRLAHGHVIDFISVGTFPVFNVADSSITIGVGVLLLGMWLEARREKDE